MPARRPRESEFMPSGSGDFRPIPDPTVLTTQQLYREITALQVLIGVRLDAVTLRLDDAIKSMSDMFSDKINSLGNFHEEKFRGIATQFAERDTRTEQTSRDYKLAIDAALKSQQEAFAEQNKSSELAIAKSEAATMKQIDQLGILIQSTVSGFNDKIDDIKSRLTLIEGRSSGITSSWGIVLGIAGLIGTIIGVLGFAYAVTKHN